MLSFKNGSFCLDGKVVPTHVAVRAAGRADKIAEKVLNRILVRRYPPPERLPTFLDPHQIEGVKFILARSRAYLAHAPGAGKTCQAIVASLHLGPQAVFIVPPGLSTNWAREIIKWTEWKNIWPSIYVVGRTSQKENADWSSDFIIVPDSMLTKGWVYERLSKIRPRLLAVDEASRFKEITAERTKALFGGRGQRIYFGLPPNAKHTVLLDGSPMPNRPMELFGPITGMAGETIDFMSLHDFGVRYCAGYFVSDKYRLDWDYSGASNQEELKERLKDFMHVVPEDRLNHPERLRSILFIELGEKESMLKAWEKKNLKNFVLKNVDESQSLGSIASHRQRIGESKVEWVINYARERLENKNESILIFAWHREVCRKIVLGLRAFRSELVTGSTDHAARDVIFRRFQDGSCRVIVGNIQAMGRGHNLQRAKRVIFAEYSWTDELNRQCEKRASRKGASHHAVRCDYIVLAGTMDETVLQKVFVKAENVKRVIG